MRLDHLLSKEPSGKLRLAGNILGQLVLEVNVTLFNLEGTGPWAKIEGDIAQLGERLPCKQEVAGSIPTISTMKN